MGVCIGFKAQLLGSLLAPSNIKAPLATVGPCDMLYFSLIGVKRIMFRKSVSQGIKGSGLLTTASSLDLLAQSVKTHASALFRTEFGRWAVVDKGWG